MTGTILVVGGVVTLLAVLGFGLTGHLRVVFVVLAAALVALTGMAAIQDSQSRDYLSLQDQYRSRYGGDFSSQVQQLFPSFQQASTGTTFRVERCISCHVPDIAQIGPTEAAKRIWEDFQKDEPNWQQIVKQEGLTGQHPAYVTSQYYDCWGETGMGYPVGAAPSSPSPAASASASPSGSAKASPSASPPASPSATAAASGGTALGEGGAMTAAQQRFYEQCYFNGAIGQQVSSSAGAATAATPSPSAATGAGTGSGQQSGGGSAAGATGQNGSGATPTQSASGGSSGGGSGSGSPGASGGGSSGGGSSSGGGGGAAAQPTAPPTIPGFVPQFLSPQQSGAGAQGLGIDQVGCIVCHNGQRLELTESGAHTNLIVNPEWDFTQGAQLYYQFCVSCHGTFGGGGIGPPLANQDRLGFFNEDYYYRCIEFGNTGFEHIGSVMPNWGSVASDFTGTPQNKTRVLSEAQIAILVEFIRHWESYTTLP